VPLNRNHVFDSQGPDLRLRGTAQQLFERYLQLGRDATSSGDRVMAESYFQYAEHYFRIIGAMQAAQQQSQQGQGGGYNQAGAGQANGHTGYNGQRRYGEGNMQDSHAQDGEDDGDRDEPDGPNLRHEDGRPAEQRLVEQRREIPIGETPPED
jgi:hypothetical protein